MAPEPLSLDDRTTGKVCRIRRKAMLAVRVGQANMNLAKLQLQLN